MAGFLFHLQVGTDLGSRLKSVVGTGTIDCGRLMACPIVSTRNKGVDGTHPIFLRHVPVFVLRWFAG